MNVASISIMGKAGILTGDKGDIMIPTSHIFEGTADNYPLDNGFTKEDFEGAGVPVYEGAMITVLGTSLQNRDISRISKILRGRPSASKWKGAHYQKAIQAQSKIRDSVSRDVKGALRLLRLDNPLVTGATLASGSLGTIGVKPTYVITVKCLSKILCHAGKVKEVVMQ
jgi:hypothetical protein